MPLPTPKSGARVALKAAAVSVTAPIMNIHGLTIFVKAVHGPMFSVAMAKAIKDKISVPPPVSRINIGLWPLRQVPLRLLVDILSP